MENPNCPKCGGTKFSVEQGIELIGTNRLFDAICCDKCKAIISVATLENTYELLNGIKVYKDVSNKK